MDDLRQRVQASLGGTYTLERELGGGGMSRVFVATEHRLGRRVVVKLLAPELAAALSTERFEREIVVAASLQQANIVPVLAAGDAEGLPYYTMPYVEGESLRARLARGPIAINEAIDILRDVAKALAYAHDRSVVHRDIKPDNILLSGRTAVVTDFGIAKAIAAAQEQTRGATLTQLGTAVGTPAYMAPEQAAGDPGTDHRADVYAFGCTAYELLAGHAPFAGLAPHKLMAAHMSDTAPSLRALRPDCPEPLERLVMQCLAKDPSHRPAGADELLRQLDAAASLSREGAAYLVGGPGMFARALAVYAAAFVAVAAVTRVLVDRQGLPEWVFGGSLIVMALGLPVILFTGYTHFVARRLAHATPTLTPRGTVQRPSAQGTLANLAVRASPHVSWSRTARGGMYALGAFALLVAGFLTLRALGIGPAGSLLAAGKLDAQDGVLVATFDASGPDSSLGGVISEAVRTNLAQSKAVHVVSTSTIVAALQRMQRPATELVDLALAREIAVREGIKAVVTGSIVPIGSGYIVTTKLVHAESGDELAAFRETADGAGDLIPTVDKLTKQLRGKIGESLKEVRDAPRLDQVTTPSLAALRSYADGLRANDVEADYPKAIALFEDAIAKDSLFAAAYVQLAYSVGNSPTARAQRPGRRDSLMATAFRLRDRLPDRERFAVEGAYYNGGFEAHRGKAIAAFERAIALDSGNVDALNSLAIALTNTRQLERAEQVYRLATARDPGNNIIQGNLASTLTARGKFDDADSVLQLIRRQAPKYPLGPRLGTLLYAKGDLDSAEAFARSEHARLKAERNPSAANFLVAVTRTRGRLRDSERFQKERASLVPAREPSAQLMDSLDAILATGHYLGQQKEAAARLEAAVRALGLPPRSAIGGMARALEIARAYAILGEPARARSVVAYFDSVATPIQRDRNRSLRDQILGEIAFAEGKAREAIELFRRAEIERDGLPLSCTACIPPMIARAFDAAQLPDSAIAHYEQFLGATGAGKVDLDSWFLAATLRRLGELYEAKGDQAKAAGYYGRFVELWKRADPELQPAVRDVQQRLERIQARRG